MKPEIKKLWVDALRSKQYEQTQNVLKGDLPSGKVGYCCLGVLTDLHAKATGSSFEECRDIDREVVGKRTQAWSGLDYENPVIGGCSLSGHNDGDFTCERIPKTFDEIAYLIETYL